MNKNKISTLLNGTAVFNNSFCQNKYKNKKRSECINFYKRHSSEMNNKIFVCPFGYACIFAKDNVVSSLIDNRYCDISKINSRQKYKKRALHSNDFFLLENIDQLIGEINNDQILQIYKDTFHDLKNNNRYLLDCFEITSINDSDSYLDLRKNISHLSSIFLEHSNRIENTKSLIDTKEIYIEELNNIEKIVKKVLKNKYLDDINAKDLKSVFDFIDYRIRYMKKLLNDNDGGANKNDFKKLNLVAIISKLRHALKITANKKGQRIVFNSSQNQDFIIQAFDDLYLGFFILLENAVKYAPFETEITIRLTTRDSSEFCITISNESADVGNIELLTNKGVQGDNHKDGNGIGLSIAKTIFEKSNLQFCIHYDCCQFKCEIKSTNF